MEYHAYVCKNFRNSIIEFNNKEWATMTKVQREEIFEHYSVVVRADSGSTCTFTWDSQEIHDFYAESGATVARVRRCWPARLVGRPPAQATRRKTARTSAQ